VASSALPSGPPLPEPLPSASVPSEPASGKDPLLVAPLLLLVLLAPLLVPPPVLLPLLLPARLLLPLLPVLPPLLLTPLLLGPPPLVDPPAVSLAGSPSSAAQPPAALNAAAVVNAHSAHATAPEVQRRILSPAPAAAPAKRMTATLLWYFTLAKSRNTQKKPPRCVGRALFCAVRRGLARRPPVG
jgi:hypothetical protein